MAARGTERKLREGTMLLAADVGGTHVRFGLYSQEKGPASPLVQATYLSRRYASLETAAGRFLARIKEPVTAACFGVAGPVLGQEARITNLPWVVRAEELAAALQVSSVILINDVAAMAYAVPVLEPGDVIILQKGNPDPQGNIAVIAPGTGLGEAFVTRDGSRDRVCASEGGHGDFAPNSDLEMALLKTLLRKYGHVSYDRICSGQGIADIYHFLKTREDAAEPSWLAKKLSDFRDPVPIIVSAGLDQKKQVPLCVKTLRVFVSILGAEAGNLALRALSTGGIYMGGGIIGHLLPCLAEGRFLEAFRKKGRMSELMARMPVFVIRHPHAALLGAARYGLMCAAHRTIPSDDRSPG